MWIWLWIWIWMRMRIWIWIWIWIWMIVMVMVMVVVPGCGCGCSWDCGWWWLKLNLMLGILNRQQKIFSGPSYAFTKARSTGRWPARYIQVKVVKLACHLKPIPYAPCMVYKNLQFTGWFCSGKCWCAYSSTMVRINGYARYAMLGSMKPDLASQSGPPWPTVARQSPRLPTWSLSVTTGSQHHRPPAGSIPGGKGPWTHKGNNDTPVTLTFHMLKYPRGSMVLEYLPTLTPKVI